ncbi:MAG: CocE/NonD family hydrolase [Planctomycetes bacterium]|nr:CocE/NonD family hydrolase [Planctomycetota bacterium]
MPRCSTFAFVAASFAFAAWSTAQAADGAKQEPPAQTAAALAGALDKLNALVPMFDKNKDQVLTTAEQLDMGKYVVMNYGQDWGDRLDYFLRNADTNKDEKVDKAEWTTAIEGLRKSKQLEPVRQTVMVPMRDGVRLATDVFLPGGAGPFPVILMRTPYNRAKGEGFAKSQTARGLAVVSQDMRGRFGSEGENLPFIGCGWGEHQDGADTVAWIHQQPWSNGRLVTIGGSAGGITQNFLAANGAPGVTAQHISVAAASMYHHATYVGGALRLEQTDNWTRTNRFDPRAGLIIRAHPNYDDYWRTQDTTLRFAEMNTPAVHVGGWFDTFAQGTIDSFVGRQHHGGPNAQGKQKLVMGPWTHAVGKNEDGADLSFPKVEFPQAYDVGRWLDYHLLNVDNGAMREPAVAYYVMGDVRNPDAPGNEWRYADDWPVASQATPFYFRKGGSLTTDKSSDADDSLAYRFEPDNPCPTLGGCNLTIQRGPRLQNPIEQRTDVLTFTTNPLTYPMEVTGRVRSKVFISSSAVDTDLSIRLCDVYPDGKSYNMAEGMLRLRHRNSFEKPELLTPDQPVEVEVDCWSTSVVFNRGHSIRVTVTSSNSPRFDVNPGTGRPMAPGEAAVVQVNRIYCGADRPSHIVLPVVEPPAAGK